MMTFTGKPILGGQAKGPALYTDQAVNFTAAFTKPENLMPWNRSRFSDMNHPWCGENMKGKVAFFPACIGSTHTGLVLLDLVHFGLGPAAIVVEEADSLLVSGVVLSEVWYGRGIPMVSCPIAQFAELIKPGTIAEVNGDTGEITLRD
jgi:predicted aconitase with swiveling domain